jgi:MATE family multidrug resistance protein
VALGVLVSIVLLILAPVFVRLMGADGGISGPAVSYLRIRALATPAVLIVLAGHGAFRGYHDTRTPLMVAALVNGVNLVLDPILIFGAGWGLEGAALATVIAQWIGAVLFLRMLSRRQLLSRHESIRASLPTLLTLGRNGLLVSMRTAAILIALTVAAAKATRLGAEAIAAHQIVVQVWLLASMGADAFAIAGQVMVGDAVGKRDRQLVNGLTGRLAAWGVGVGGLLFLAFWFGRGILAALSSDPSVGDRAVEAGAVAALMQPIAAPLFVADGIFLGLLALGVLVGSTASGAAVAVFLILFTQLGDTLVGIWWAIAAMLVARLAVFAFAYTRSVTGALRS